MKQYLFLVLIIITTSLFAQEDEEKFISNFPNKEVLDLVTPEKLPNLDAVIILKDQQYLLESGGINYKGYILPGTYESYTKTLIVKLFNEKGVKKYGSFNFAYSEPYGEDLPNPFTVKARVLKPNGDIHVMPQDQIKTTSIEKNSGTLAKEVSFIIPDLAVNDIVQIEYTLLELMSSSQTGLFYYNEEDFVLFSNLYITLPAKNEYKFTSFPIYEVGMPKVERLREHLGTGDTYIWKIQNCQPLPEEAWSPTFEDRALLTTFHCTSIGSKTFKGWDEIAKNFVNNYMDKRSVGKSNVSLLNGINYNEKDITIEKIDKLYSAISSYFTLASTNSIVPAYEDVDKMFKDKKGDASDLVFIMYKILDNWDIPSNVVFIRDKRKGIYEPAVPSSRWFDRLGLLVNVNGTERVYDFDKSLSSTYENPWYLSDYNVAVVYEDSLRHKKLNYQFNADNCVITESHKVSNKSNFVSDSLNIFYLGSQAQIMRSKLYGTSQDDRYNFFKDKLLNKNFVSINDIKFNNYNEEQRLKVTMTGTSTMVYNEIDSFLTITPKCYNMTNLRYNLNEPFRISDILFETPFSLNFIYDFDVPANYELNESLKGTAIDGPSNSKFVIKRTCDKGKVSIKGNVKFNNNYIPVANYKDLTTFLDNCLMELEKEVVLKKKLNM